MRNWAEIGTDVYTLFRRGGADCFGGLSVLGPAPRVGSRQTTAGRRPGHRATFLRLLRESL